jgi:hypothetical protein
MSAHITSIFNKYLCDRTYLVQSRRAGPAHLAMGPYAVADGWLTRAGAAILGFDVGFGI